MRRKALQIREISKDYSVNGNEAVVSYLGKKERKD